MKKLLIIGAGGFGREVQWLVERINQKEKTWDLIGYIDDSVRKGTIINGLPVLGNLDYLLDVEDKIAVTCAIGSSVVRRKVINRLKSKSQIEFPTLIDPNVLTSDTDLLGQGVIICAGSILTVNIEIEDFVIINLNCTIGHDAKLSTFATLYPSVNISGNVVIGEETELGTGAQLVQKVSVSNNCIIGAGAVVVKDIVEPGTYVGVPTRKTQGL